MPDYKEMYYKLNNALTDAITILQEAQKDAEEIYINSEEATVDRLKVVPLLKTYSNVTEKENGSQAQ